MRASKTKQHEAPTGILAHMNKWPLLSREQEVALATRYQQTGDTHAAHTLACSNLRFVVKIAHDYAGYGLDLNDLIQEGNMGLFIAVKKYDPNRGYRLISYAVWWIRAYIQSYVMRSWSLVKIGTTQVERKLFFKLRSTRSRLESATPGDSATVSAIARELGVDEASVSSTEMRLAGRDYSLDVNVAPESRQTRRDELLDSAPTPEQMYSRNEARQVLHKHFEESLLELKERERYVVRHRLMSDEPQTLRRLGMRLRVSRERVRQIQNTAMRKLQVRFEAADLGTAATLSS